MSQNNLNKEESKKKLKELVESISFAMFTSNLHHPPFHTVPMTTKKVDEEGNLWFLSNRTSQHNLNIEKDAKVLLNFANSSDFEFITIYATAKIVVDQKVFEELK